MLCSISATSRRARSSSSCSGCTEDDLAGHVLRQGGWEAASFPAIAEEDETHVMEAPFGRTRTFRRATGEALNEEREPLATLAEIRATIGEYNFAAQYQQRYCRVEEGRGGLRLGQSPRFPSPLIKPDVRISRIRLSDRLHGRPTASGLEVERVGSRRIFRGFRSRKTGARLVRAPCAVWRGSGERSR